MLSQKAVTALVFLIAILLVVVVIVGLVQGLLEVTGVAITLCSVLTGIVGGAMYRSRSDKDGGSGP